MTNKTVDKVPRRIPVTEGLKLLGDGTQGVLIGRCCRKCGEYVFGSPRFCPNCTSSELEEVELSKEGTLRTYTIIYVPPPGWQGDIPYILGSVELPEGPEIVTEVIDCPKEKLKVGMRMELVITVGGRDQDNNETMVYKWRPISQPQ